MLDGSVVGLSHYEVELDVGARRSSMAVRLSGDVSGATGTPVRVTFYRGMPIRVDGPALKADVEGNSSIRDDIISRSGASAFLGVDLVEAVEVDVALVAEPGWIDKQRLRTKITEAEVDPYGDTHLYMEVHDPAREPFAAPHPSLRP